MSIFRFLDNAAIFEQPAWVIFYLKSFVNRQRFDSYNNYYAKSYKPVLKEGKVIDCWIF